ncbi:MAG: thiamine pyrophosphate-dependent dehydrogenase E1 component subunit alpha [Rhodospirillaceae bacterium]|jgi:acetoin:2,6-dichlorophenolindophenol oxidoreductase subunit alpha|nr:thiamine pyrophosphate-dependent dehydrogenase E1 component subunit alpha [Rhodospirillaceae bacterium]MBT6138685.1 thiamine pyrophosphate-dependent dehydrogenase E1 component subunit alpha [Rhodospirillaceae bacterium]
MEITPEKQREMLRLMQTIRRFEERASDDYVAGDIHGVVHCYIGEEAVAVGVCSALEREDRIISTHRGHGHCVAKGADLNRMMAELYGRETGYCKGKGGSMHIADFNIGMLGANGIVCGGLSIITGAGLAAQMEGKGGVAVCFFGDGASSAGPFHEAMNIAANWKLPVLYVVENNLWAMDTSAAEAVSVADIATRAAGYGIPGVIVDGNDVLEVHRVASEAVARARAGEGPTLIECKTYRHRRHTERPTQSDARPPEEIAAWMKKDPIDRLVAHLQGQQGQLNEAEWGAMNDEIMNEVERAVEFAKASAFPKPEAALDDVFAD